MSGDYRRVCITLAGLALLTGAQQPAKKTEAAKSDRQEKAAPSQTAAPTEVTNPPYRPYTQYNPDPCYQSKDHDTADLCAQWRAAIAAEKAAHEARRATNWAIVAAGLSFVGLVFIVWSLLQTQGALGEARRSRLVAQRANARATRQAISGAADTAKALAIAERNASAADRQVATAEDTAKRQLRAYVNITRFEVSVIDKGETDCVIIDYTNSGQTPALECRAYFQSVIVNGGDRHTELDTPFSTDVPSKSVIGRNSTSNVIVRMPGFKDITPEIIAGELVAFINGWVKYVDVFGDGHTTHFRLFCDAGTVLNRGFAIAPTGNLAD